MKHINPFPVKNYISKEYFCDREEELNILFRNAKNNINTTLISPRRLGKTGLLFRFIEDLEEKTNTIAVYIDIYSSRSLSDFVELFAIGILKKFPEKTSFGKKFMKLLKGLRPVFTFDSFTGYPQIQFMYQSENDKEYTLQKLFTFLNNQSFPVIIAIDEFQQIAVYPEKNVEALLRTYIQQLKNINFIFSGSQKHTLVEMFLSAKRPFYASTQFLHLNTIDREKYKSFIVEMFEKGNKSISDEAVEHILNRSKEYTFYTQSLCNRLYSFRKITIETVNNEFFQLLKENEPVYFQYRNLLTAKQWNFLVALAKEESVSQIYAKDFIRKYDLGTPSGLRRIIDSLLEKEMILELNTAQQIQYCVYDVFLMRWLQLTYFTTA